MKNYLVLYDIFNTKRAYKIRKYLYKHTTGGQKSALEIPLDGKLSDKLIFKLNSYTKDIDKINIVKIYKNPILLGKASQLNTISNGVIVWK